VLAAGIIAMQTAEIRKLPLSMPVKVGFLIFAAAMLVFSWYIVAITWTNFGAAIAFAAVCAIFVPVRRDKLMSEATQKIVRHHVEHRGRPVTMEMVGTPKYGQRSRFPWSGLLQPLAVAATFYVVSVAWPEALEFIYTQRWMLLGLALYMGFLAVYSLLFAPKHPVQVGTETRRVP
jgi:hypothetical protein